MNCKPGDLAMFTKLWRPTREHPDGGAYLLGRVCKVISLEMFQGHPFWIFEPPNAFNAPGKPDARTINDSCLTPIKGIEPTTEVTKELEMT